MSQQRPQKRAQKFFKTLTLTDGRFSPHIAKYFKKGLYCPGWLAGWLAGRTYVRTPKTKLHRFQRGFKNCMYTKTNQPTNQQSHPAQPSKQPVVTTRLVGLSPTRRERKTSLPSSGFSAQTFGRFIKRTYLLQHSNQLF